MAQTQFRGKTRLAQETILHKAFHVDASWTAPAVGRPEGAPIYESGTNIITIQGPTAFLSPIVAYAKSNGAQVWATVIDAPTFHTESGFTWLWGVTAGGLVLVGKCPQDWPGVNHRYLYALDAASGAFVWETPRTIVPGNRGNPELVFNDTHLYYRWWNPATAEDFIVCADLATGADVWSKGAATDQFAGGATNFSCIIATNADGTDRAFLHAGFNGQLEGVQHIVARNLLTGAVTALSDPIPLGGQPLQLAYSPWDEIVVVTRFGFDAPEKIFTFHWEGDYFRQIATVDASHPGVAGQYPCVVRVRDSIGNIVTGFVHFRGANTPNARWVLSRIDGVTMAEFSNWNLSNGTYWAFDSNGTLLYVSGDWVSGWMTWYDRNATGNYVQGPFVQTGGSAFMVPCWTTSDTYMNEGDSLVSKGFVTKFNNTGIRQRRRTGGDRYIDL